MGAVKKVVPQESRPSLKPAETVEDRENQLIALSIDLVEERLRNGTASAQEVCHFLKLGTTKERLERDKMAEEMKLLRAKTEALEAQKKNDEIYAEALSAFRRYSGTVNVDV